MQDHKEIVGLAADIVAAYVRGNMIADRDVPGLIRSVFDALAAAGSNAAAPQPQNLVPAVAIKKSVQADFIVCLEDGKRFKSLRRHIMSKYGLTPEAYRSKWGLGPDYPMVAPNYAKARSDLAKRMGLGTKRGEAASASKAGKASAANQGAKRKRKTGSK